LWYDITKETCDMMFLWYSDMLWWICFEYFLKIFLWYCILWYSEHADVFSGLGLGNPNAIYASVESWCAWVNCVVSGSGLKNSNEKLTYFFAFGFPKLKLKFTFFCFRVPNLNAKWLFFAFEFGKSEHKFSPARSRQRGADVTYQRSVLINILLGRLISLIIYLKTFKKNTLHLKGGVATPTLLPNSRAFFSIFIRYFFRTNILPFQSNQVFASVIKCCI